jgi:hypothetical protein
MGYLGYIYVEAKSFEILFEIGNSGIRFAERSRGVYRAIGETKRGMIVKDRGGVD